MRPGTVAGADRLLLHIAGAEDDVGRRQLDAVAGVIILSMAVTFAEGAELCRCRQPFLADLGDDVDDARERVGAVQRRLADWRTSIRSIELFGIEFKSTVDGMPLALAPLTKRRPSTRTSVRLAPR